MVDGPFSHENRPWHSDECLDNMNSEFATCMATTPSDGRDVLKDWMMWKVEMDYCHDRPKVMVRCLEYGDRQIAAKREGKELERLRHTTDQYSTPHHGSLWDGWEKHGGPHFPLRRTSAGPPVTPLDPTVVPRDPPLTVGDPPPRPRQPHS